MTYSIGDYFILETNSLASSEMMERWITIHPESDLIDYYLFLEEVRPQDIDFRYFYIFKKDDNGREIPCARLYLQIVRFNQKNISLSNPLLSFSVSSFLRLRPFKLMIFGNSFAVDFPPVHFDEKTIDANTLTDLICTISHRFKHDVLILKDIPNQLDSDLRKREKLEVYKADLTMTLTLRERWKNFNDYLSDLNKKYRKRAEKILLKGSNLELREIKINDFANYASRINELLTQVAKKQMIRIGIVDDRYILNYMNRFPASFKLHGIFLNSQLIAFYTSIDRGKMLEIHYIGMDYTYNESHALYFNILFFSLKQAILEGRKSLELGRTAREAKASLGAEAEFFNDYIRINHPLARFLTRSLTTIFQRSMGDQWMNRKPLKPIKS